MVESDTKSSSEEKEKINGSSSQETEVASRLPDSQVQGNLNLQPGGHARNNDILRDVMVSPNPAFRGEEIEVKAAATRPINSLIIRFSGPQPFDVALELKQTNESVSEWSAFVVTPSIPGIYQYRTVINLDDGTLFESPIDTRNFLEVRP